MDGFSKYLGLPIFLLLSTWGAYETVLKVIDRLNATRAEILKAASGKNEVLGVSPASLAEHMLNADWVFLALGLCLLLLHYIAVVMMIPAIMRAVVREQRRKWLASTKQEEDGWLTVMMAPRLKRLNHVDIACYGIMLMSTFVLLGVLLGCAQDYLLMKKVIAGASQQPSSTSPGTKQEISTYNPPHGSAATTRTAPR